MGCKADRRGKFKVLDTIGRYGITFQIAMMEAVAGERLLNSLWQRVDEKAAVMQDPNGEDQWGDEEDDQDDDFLDDIKVYTTAP